jgi:osmotically-inducible protein OsmY
MFRLLSLIIIAVALSLVTACQTTKKPTVYLENDPLSRAVQAKLVSDSAFARVDVDSDRERGMVYLIGVVDSTWQKVRATELALQVNGVHWVRNNLQIQRPIP